jgi:hypothetical protein
MSCIFNTPQLLNTVYYNSLLVSKRNIHLCTVLPTPMATLALATDCKILHAYNCKEQALFFA